MEVTSKRKEFAPTGASSFFYVKTVFWKGLILPDKANKKSQKLSPCDEKTKITEVYHFPLTLLYSERPKLRRVLALLSSKELTHSSLSVQ